MFNVPTATPTINPYIMNDTMSAANDTAIYYLNLTRTRAHHVRQVLAHAEILTEAGHLQCKRWLIRSTEGTMWLVVGPSDEGDINRSERLESQWFALRIA